MSNICQAVILGQPLNALPAAAFPPGVPEPVGTLVDYLFDHGLAVPALLQSPGRGTFAGLGAVRAALDKGWGGAADLASAPGVDCHEAVGTGTARSSPPPHLNAYAPSSLEPNGILCRGEQRLQAHCLPRHRNAFDASFLEPNCIL
jgi:hypothetical protein